MRLLAIDLRESAVHGVRAVQRVEIEGKPSLFLFEVDRGPRGPLLVAWEQRDAFSGEDAAATPYDLPWRFPRARATDALGAAVPVQVKDGRLSLAISLTPIYIEPER